jgi:metal-sulfur cluster biosynthetic enzyme
MNTEEIRSALRGVIDPELGINIVDLGLVYDMTVNGNAIDVAMTMTSPSCPLGEYLVESVERALSLSFPHTQLSVALVWEPAWNPEMITAEGRKKLGWVEQPRHAA